MCSVSSLPKLVLSASSQIYIYTFFCVQHSLQSFSFLFIVSWWYVVCFVVSLFPEHDFFFCIHRDCFFFVCKSSCKVWVNRRTLSPFGQQWASFWADSFYLLLRLQCKQARQCVCTWNVYSSNWTSDLHCSHVLWPRSIVSYKEGRKWLSKAVFIVSHILVISKVTITTALRLVLWA